jgi:Flp pilus assembly protein TadG
MLDAARSKIAERMRRLMPGRIARRFVRQQDGAAAVEFALVAAPFLALLFSILETAFVFFAGQTLEAATANSARLIMTGQAQSQGFSQDQFKTAVCSRIFGLFDCANGVYVDVKTYNSYGAISNTAPITNGVLDPAKTGYNTGDVGSIVVVSLYYQWPIYVSMFNSNLASSNLSGGNRLLTATSVFRVEPFK